MNAPYIRYRQGPCGPRPVGRLHVFRMQRHKEWIVPESIQEEMRREGKDVLTRVPPEPDNPLGHHWIGLSIGGIGIHGTIAPSSVYHFRFLEVHGDVYKRRGDPIRRKGRYCPRRDEVLESEKVKET